MREPGHLLGALLPLPVQLDDDEARAWRRGTCRPRRSCGRRSTGPIVATSTIEPRLPSIGMAFIRTPAAPSSRSICGGAWRTIWPDGISGSSRRVPRSVVLNLPPVVGRGLSIGVGLSSDYPADDGRNVVVATRGTHGTGSPAVASGHGTAASSLAVSVHGPAGVLDLVVPAAASAVDVAREYAEQSGLDGGTRAVHAARPATPARRGARRLGHPLRRPPRGDHVADRARPAPTRRPLC